MLKKKKEYKNNNKQIEKKSCLLVIKARLENVDNGTA